MNLQPSLLLFSEADKTALIENIKRLKLTHVKEICKALALPLKGNKGDLLDRLLQFINARTTAVLGAPELLALQTLVVKLIYCSPLPNYHQLVNAIRSGVVSEASVAALLQSFQNAANLTPLNVRPQLAPSGASKSSNGLALGQNGNYNAQRSILNSPHPLLMNGMNSLSMIGNLNAMATMNRSIGGMNGLNVHGTHMSPMNSSIGHMPQVNAVQGHAIMANRLSDPDTYTGPMLLFKSTLFYLLRRLISTAQVLRVSKGRNVKTFRMKLHSSDVRLLRENPNARVYLFCGSETTPDHTNTPIQFPPIEIYVDDVLTKQFTKGIKGKPGSARPADLTPYFALYEKLILVRIVYSDALEKYILYTYIVEELPLETLVDQISKKAHIPTSATKVQIQKQNEASEDDCDIVVATSSLTLRCPLTYARMKIPVRSIECDHIQCFDCESFLSMQLKIPLWQCPVCSKYVDQNLLVVSDYLQEILAETTESVDSVVLNADGTWKAVEEVASLSDSDEDEPSAAKSASLANNNINEQSVFKAPEDPIEVISLDSDSEDEAPQIQTAQMQASQAQASQVTLVPSVLTAPEQQTQTSIQSSPLTEVPQQENHVKSPEVFSDKAMESLPRTYSSLNAAKLQSSLPDSNGQQAGSASLSDSPLSVVSEVSLHNGLGSFLGNERMALSTTDTVAKQLLSDLSNKNNDNEEDEDEDIIARPRRRAVINDNSDTEPSRPSSANVASSYVDRDDMEEDTTFHHSDSIAPNYSESSGEEEETALAKLSRPKTKESTECRQSHDTTAPMSKFNEVPEEAQFLKGMRSLSSLGPNEDPFANTTQSNQKQKPAIDRVSEQSTSSNGIMGGNDVASVLKDSPAVSSILGQSVMINPIAFSFNVSNGKDSTAVKPQILTSSASSVTELKNDANLLNSTKDSQVSEISKAYATLRHLQPLYHQLVSESRAKINAYMRSGANSYSGNPAPVILAESSMQPAENSGLPVRAKSVSAVTPLSTIESSNAGVENANNLEVIVTPRKRNNSVTGAREIFEATQASPSLRASHSSSTTLEVLTDAARSLMADASTTLETQKQYSRNPFAEFKGSNFRTLDNNCTEKPSQAVPQSSDLLLEPFSHAPTVSSAIQGLTMTSPNNRKRQGVEGSQYERSWNKRPNQSPLTPKINNNIAYVSSTSINHAGSGRKAKFDPSQIDVADIIELD